jgi:uncharacterized protein YjdB
MRFFRGFSFLALLLSAACTKNYYSTGPSEQEVKKSISITLDSLRLVVSQEWQLNTAVIVPAGMSNALTWSTSCNKRVTVSVTGEIRADSVGTCRITATLVADSKVTATLHLTVYAPLTVKITPLSSTVGIGQTRDFTFTFSGGLPGTAEKGGTCFSSDAARASISRVPNTEICRVLGLSLNSPPHIPIQVGVKSVGTDPVNGNVEASASLVVTP